MRDILPRPNLPMTALAGGIVRMRPAISDRISTAAGAALWVFLSALSLAGAPAAASQLFTLSDFTFEDGSAGTIVHSL